MRTEGDKVPRILDIVHKFSIGSVVRHFRLIHSGLRRSYFSDDGNTPLLKDIFSRLVL